MSMSALAETTCVVCNIRTSVTKSKRVPVDKIPSLRLLEVPQDLKDLIIKSQPLRSKPPPTSSGVNGNTARTGQISSGNSFTMRSVSIRVDPAL